MADLVERVVDVDITTETGTTSTANFDIPLFISTHNVTPDRVLSFRSPDDVLDTGFDETHPVYLFTSLCFQGNAAPSQVLVGRKLLEDATLTVSDVADDTKYGFTIRVGSTVTVVSVTSGTSSTAVTIAGLINTELSGVSGVTVVDNIDGTLTITPSDLSVDFAIYKISDNLSLQYNADVTESYEDTYSILSDQDVVDWFFLASEDHSDSAILSLTALAEANNDFFVTSSPDTVNIYDSGVTNDIWSQLIDLSYQNVHLLPYADADTVYPEGAIIGAIADLTPGTYTLNAFPLTGVSVQKLSCWWWFLSKLLRTGWKFR
jgi:hypothetical protein